MLQILLALFLVVPLAEIWLLITVGTTIGVGWTVALVVLTAVIGALLVRVQGIATLARSRAMLQRGELPAIELLEGVALLMAGALLLTPGFFTDAVGFVLLISPLRRGLVETILRRGIIRPVVQADGRPSGTDARRTIEGDFRRVDD